MRNLVVRPGSTAADDRRSDLPRGLVVERFGSAWVDSCSGQFSLLVERGRMIERGRTVREVRNVLLKGDIGETLAGVEAVGSDFQVSDDVVPCGKGGVVRTGVAGPSVRFNALLVG